EKYDLPAEPDFKNIFASLPTCTWLLLSHWQVSFLIGEHVPVLGRLVKNKHLAAAVAFGGLHRQKRCQSGLEGEFKQN
ncbi:MAG: hypothetical protein WCE69_15260, partial [Aestuariivirga sp.]